MKQKRNWMTAAAMAAALIYGGIGAFAFTLDKEQQKEFKNSDKIGMRLDYSDILINGDAPEEFVQDYGEEKGKSEADIAEDLFSLMDLVYTYPSELLPTTLRSQLGKGKNRGYLSKDTQKFNILVKLKSFTTKGGFSVDVCVYSDDPSDNYMFSLTSEDGKWNDDEVLMKEGAAKLGAMIVARLDDWCRFGFPKDLKASN